MNQLRLTRRGRMFAALLLTIIAALFITWSPATATAATKKHHAHHVRKQLHTQHVRKQATSDVTGLKVGVPIWPHGRVYYYTALKHSRWALMTAVHLWNHSGAKIRFIRTSRRKANVVLRYDPFMRCGYGLTQLSWDGRGSHHTNYHGVVTMGIPNVEGGQGCSRFGETLVLAHELGHVLGLGHVKNRCSVMNPAHVDGVAPEFCLPKVDGKPSSVSHTGQWRCRVLERIDVQHVKRMYGGHVNRVRSNPWCPTYTAVQTPANLTTTYSNNPGVGPAVTVSFTRPPDPTLPPFMRYEQMSQTTRYTIARQPSTSCAHNPFNYAVQIERQPFTVQPGQTQTMQDFPDTSGTYCYSVWAIDTSGRPSAQPAVSFVTFTTPA